MDTAIRDAVKKALNHFGLADLPFVIEWPADMSHGDYATNAALTGYAQLKTKEIENTDDFRSIKHNPREFAQALAKVIEEELGESVQSVEVAGPGFINVRLAPQIVAAALTRAYEEGGAWGHGTSRAQQTVVFEYSCPNPFKEMHIGHLMSAVIGEAFTRIIEGQGARVIRDTYGGDVGPHVAKALWALKERGITEAATSTELGDAYAHGSRSYEESEKARAEIDALNTALYAALAKEDTERTDEERALLEMWRHGRELSYEAHKATWKMLGTAFDYIIHESESTPIGMRVVKDGLARGVFEESEGAVIYKGEKKGLHTLVFITSRGTPTYEAKDVGLAFLKEERLAPFDYSYIMTAAEQSGHFAVFLAALEDIAPVVAQKTAHIPHGFLRLTSGKMSSREGNVITARELLLDLIERASERNSDPVIAEQVAVAAVKYLVLRQAPGGDIIFDPEKSLSLEGDSGPYLQYALVRAKSILVQGTEAGDATPYAQETLARLIARFPEVVVRAEALRAPHTLTQYLTQLAGEWNSFYARERIVGSEDEQAKLALVRAFAVTMENGLRFLGIPAPEKL